MENGRKQRSNRKRDPASTRRGTSLRLERSLMGRIDNVRQATPRSAWIRQAIEERLANEEPDVEGARSDSTR